MDYLTADQVDGFVECFEAFDTTGDGTIDKTELSVILRALGMKYSEAEIMDIMAVKDRDGSGGLCFAEFLALMASEMRDMSGEDEVKDAFERACGDDGLLGEQELLQMAADMKVQLIPSQARAMLAEAARDSSDPGAADTASTAPRISQQDAVKLMQGQ